MDGGKRKTSAKLVIVCEGKLRTETENAVLCSGDALAGFRSTY